MMSNYVDIAAKVEANAAAGDTDRAPADAAGGRQYGVQIEEIVIDRDLFDVRETRPQ